MNNRRKQQLLYLVADIVSALLVWLSFLLFRWLVYQGKVFSVEEVLIPAFNFYQPILLYPLFCIAIYYLSGFYLRPIGKSFGSVLTFTLFSSLIISLSSFFVILIDDRVPDYHLYLWSLLVLFLFQFLLSLFPRLLVMGITRTKLQKRTFTIQTLGQVESFIAAHRVKAFDRVLIQINHDERERDLYTIIQKIYPQQVEIAVVPGLFDLMTGAARIGELDEQPYVEITELRMSAPALCIKRACDVLWSLTAILLLLPLYVLIAIVVKWDSEGSVFYSQERIGKYGVPFRILKFRTMCADSEGDTPQLTMDDDPRITKVGRVLRKYRLDELPQMWNVLVGDMSFVGPRPERRFFIDQITQQAPYYCLLYKVRPGLTSWGPIRVGYTDTLEKMIERLNYDIAYVENMSLALDVKILFHTISVILDGKGK